MSTTHKKTITQVTQYALDGKEMEAIELAKEVQSYTPNDTLLTQYIRVYLANQREGNASAKTRSEIIGTTKKVYKQKGTGRARHGSKKAPIFKGGGVVGGPKPREHRLELSKNQKKLSLLSAVAKQLQAGAIAAVDSTVTSVQPKTKQFMPLMKVLGITRGKILFVLPDAKPIGMIKSLRNVDKVCTTHMGQLNAYDILDAKKVLFVTQAFDAMQKMYSK